MGDWTQRLEKALLQGVELRQGRSATTLGLEKIVLVNASGKGHRPEHRTGIFHAYDPRQKKGWVTGRLVPEARLIHAEIDPHTETDPLKDVDHPWIMPTYTPKRILHEDTWYWWQPRLYTPHHVPLAALYDIEERALADVGVQGVDVLALLAQHGLIHTDPKASNIIVIPHGRDGKRIPAQAFGPGTTPDDWEELGQRHGPLRIQRPYLIDLETLVRKDRELINFTRSYISADQERHLATASLESSLYVFEKTILRCAARSRLAGKQWVSQLSTHADKLLEKEADPADATKILETPKRSDRRWRRAQQGLIATLILAAGMGVRAEHRQALTENTETAAIQEILDGETTDQELGRLAYALARKIEDQVRRGIYPTTHPFLEGNIKENLEMDVPPTMVPGRFLRNETVQDVEILFPAGGAATRLLHAATMPGIDPIVAQAARANALAHAYWIMRSNDLPVTNTTPLLEQYRRSGEEILLDALLKNGDALVANERRCEYGSVIPIARPQGFGPCLFVLGDDLQAVEELVAASQASVFAHVSDRYSAVAGRVLRSVLDNLPEGYVPSTIRLEDGTSASRHHALGQAYLANALSKSYRVLGEPSYRAIADSLTRDLLRGGISRYLGETVEEQYPVSTFPLALAVETAGLLRLPAAAVRPAIETLGDYIPKPVVHRQLPLDRVSWPRQELLGGVCLETQEGEKTFWCDIGYLPADARFLSGLAKYVEKRKGETP